MARPVYSLHLFAGAGGVFSRICCREYGPCAPSRSKSSPAESSPCDTRAWQSGTTFGLSGATTPIAAEPSSGSGNTRRSWLWQGVSRARTFLLRAREGVSTESGADCGASSPESFAKYDRATSLWKTPHCLPIGGLDVFLGTWPRSGMMLDGTCWGLPTWAPDTGGSGCGSLDGLPKRWGGGWPTPTASGDLHYRLRGDTEGSKCLAAVVAHAHRPRFAEQRGAEPMVPPNAPAERGSCAAVERERGWRDVPDTAKPRLQDRDGGHPRPREADQSQRFGGATFPTPRCHDAKPSCQSEARRHSPSLSTFVKLDEP